MKTANSSLDISFSFLEGLFILTQEISSVIRNNPYQKGFVSKVKVVESASHPAALQIH